MKITFFEEFSTQRNLDQLKLVTFPTKLYIAAQNLQEFRKFEKQLPVPLIYWLVLDMKDGYWISPFSKRGALVKHFKEVERESLAFMLDLENPIFAPWLYFIELPNFLRNKHFIKKFIQTAKPGLTLVEMSGDEKKLQRWGLSYESDIAYIAKMAYTSMMRGPRERRTARLHRICDAGIKKYGKRFKIGLGCITHGISGTEPILTPEQLGEDIEIVKRVGVSEAIIFRLGGLNEDYVKIIKEKMI